MRVLSSILRDAFCAAVLFAATISLAVGAEESADAIDKPAEGVDETLARWNEKKLEADWLTLELAQRLFEGATSVDPLEGTPPAAPVMADGQLAGYLFLTIDSTPSLGFSIQPFFIAVGLRLDGTLTGIEIVEHHEPIIDLYMLQERVPGFVDQFSGMDIRESIRVRLTRAKEPGTIDGISGATISAVLFNDAIFNAARLVAAGRGFSLSDQPMVNLIDYRDIAFSALVADGSVGRLLVTKADLEGTAVDDPAVASDQEVLGLAGIDDESLLIDLHFAPVTTPTIGRNLFGERKYNMFVSGRDHRDLMVVLMARGRYLFDDQKLQISGTLERVRILQGDKTFPLTRENYRYINFLPGKDKPPITQVGLYWLKAADGIDPLAPWRLEVVVQDRNGTDQAVFGADHALAEEYIVRPKTVASSESFGGPIWMSAWRAQATNIAILVAALAVLVGILVFMDTLTRRRRLFTAIRMTYMAFVLVWLGWITGAQVTVINVLTWLQGVVGVFSVDVFMSDPLIVVLIGFVVVTFFIWGRGVFCGWLCPFGAMQELLAKLARLLRVPEMKLSYQTHRVLWPVKYVVLAVLVGLSFYSMSDAGVASEVEPFKTAITMGFAREWPFVVYAVALLVVGLFVERFFCRFVCPLGAAMAIGGLLRWRKYDPLKRRPECGSPCQLCTRQCPIQAIEPSGKINMNECFYCLDCQELYFDEHLCPPLAVERKRRDRAKMPAAAE
jgi:NosR/NirI family nitrous oxide reductase transcriptional regulator